MLRLVISTFAVLGFMNFVVSDPARRFRLRNDVIYTVETTDNHSTCSEDDAKAWSYDFHNCFVDKKYKDGGKDLNNIVDRILDLSKDCVKTSTKECRPTYDGFVTIMDKVIEQMKEYCFMYLEHIIHDRHKIKDLECVEGSLTNKTYRDCFKNMLREGHVSELKLQRDVKKAISCTNGSNKGCSKKAKTSLNRMVRDIIGVKQPAKEDIEDDPKPEPPKPWYHYIIQPFVSFWSSVRSFFGF